MHTEMCSCLELNGTLITVHANLYVELGVSGDADGSKLHLSFYDLLLHLQQQKMYNK